MRKNFFNSERSPKAVGGTTAIEKFSKTDVAIIGMAGQLPSAENLDAFWTNLSNRVDGVIDYPDDRKKEIAKYLAFKNVAYTDEDFRFKRKGFLQSIDGFDYKFFKLTAKEGSVMNPAQRIFLETTYHAIESAGYACSKMRGSNTGIYLGYTGGSSEYLELIKEIEPAFATMAYPANLPSVIASRISYLMDFKGPSMLIDTACSSSMVAFYLACQAVRNGTCDTAIAGGINLSWMPFEEENRGLGILSTSGKTKTFDNSSDGTVGGEGCVAIFIKPLHKALRDNDNILAVVKGIACNQDGSSIGITAPNALAQADVMEKAWAEARVNPETISYIEAHGTGTTLGDPIEIDGITKAFKKHTDKKQFCAIGSVKANIGHLNSVAGVVGIAKAVLALKNKAIPPLLHFERPNSKINFETSPVYINDRLAPWDAPANTPRRCGVSSFGMSGTNAHVILEEAPGIAVAETTVEPATFLFTLSAKSNTALHNLVHQYSAYVDTAPDGVTIDAICYTASAGREHHDHRLSFVVNTIETLAAKLALLKTQSPEQLAAQGICYGIVPRDTKTQVDLSVLTPFTADTLSKLSEAYVAGADVSWEKLYSAKSSRRVSLPVYPFEHKRCWITYPDEDIAATQRKAPTVLDSFKKSTPEMNSDQNTKANTATSAAPQTVGKIQAVEEIVSQQLKLMEQQLAVLKGQPANVARQALPVVPATQRPQVNVGSTKSNHEKTVAAVPKPATATDDSLNDLTENQQRYIRNFIAAFNLKTKTSKSLTQENRKWYANNRHVAGYHQVYKEMMYPILVDHAKGAKITDVDGNQYTDFCMGFGVYLLGYNHPAVVKGIAEQADKGSYLGAMSALPGEVAKLVCELTGVERVAFYNSGTEAVMLALRLARAATSKTKIAMFVGSYHGTYDGVLAQKDRFSKDNKAVPKSTGIPQSILDEVLFLDYGTPASLEAIKKHRHELAGVLVEPVQSRRPEFQPKEYLLQLRALTQELNIPLIFDEIITGFRIHPGGSQAWFGIQADLVTYGKIAGGGLPLGIIAGKAEYMMGVDGGMWQYGDDSQPTFDHRKTFVAGTFCHHPLAMASAKAALLHLKNEGPALQEALNDRTSRMAETLNDFFKQNHYDVNIVNFGSLFQIRTNYNLSLIVYHFLAKGIYAWEGMTFFISTAHSEEDVQFLIAVFKEVLHDLRQQGFIPAAGKRNAIEAGEIKIIAPSQNSAQDETISQTALVKIPLTEEQSRLWFLSVAEENASVAFNSSRVITVEGQVSKPAFSNAVAKLIARHELLRAVSIDGDYATVQPSLDYEVNYFSLPEEGGVYAFVHREKGKAFNLAQGPFFRIHVVEERQQFMFVLIIHHIIADGWSIGVLLKELSALYLAECEQTQASLAEVVSFTQYIEWEKANHQGPQDEAARQFWTNQFSKGIRQTVLPHDVLETKQMLSGSSFVLKIDPATTGELKSLARKEGATLFMLLLASFTAFVEKLSGDKSILIGIPSAGQLNMEAESLVGCCVQMKPFHLGIDGDSTFASLLAAVKRQWLDIYKFRNFQYTELAKEGNFDIPSINITFNMDAPSPHEESANDSRGALYKKESEFNKYDLFLNVAEVGKTLKLTFQYNNARYPEAIMEGWVNGFRNLIHHILADPTSALTDIRLTSPAGDGETVVQKRKTKRKGSAAKKFSAETLLMAAKANHIARVLDERTLTKGDRVFILLDNHADIVASAWGALKAGFSYVLLNGSVAGDALLADIRSSVTLSTAALASGYDTDLVDLTQWPDTSTDLSGADAIGGETTNYISNIDLAYHESLLQKFEIGNASSITILTRGLSSDFIVDISLAAMLAGKKVAYTESSDGLWESIETDKAKSALVLHKFAWTEMTRTLEHYPSVKNLQTSVVVIGETPLLNEYVRVWHNAIKMSRLFFGYFSNVIGKLVTAIELAENEESIVAPLGTLLEPMRYQLLDSHHNTVLDGIVGDLYFSDANDKQQNETQNLVKCVAGCRRVKNDQLSLDLRSNGAFILDTLVSDAAGLLNNVQSISLARTDGRFTARVQYVVDKVSNDDALETHLRKYFPNHLLPTVWSSSAANENPGQAAADETEQKLIGIFSAVLNTHRVGVHDNFFALGGNSLRAVQVVAKIHIAFQVKIALRKIFTHPTIGQLADIIKGTARSAYEPIVAVDEQPYYELSNAQKRLWIVSQFQHGQAAYNISKTYRITGVFNGSAFEKAFQTVVARHESLRTIFVLVDGEPKQKILDNKTCGFNIRYVDIRTEADKEQIIRQRVDESERAVFALEKDVPLRVQVIHVDEQAYVVSLTIHHIAADGWSMEILVNEVIACYNAIQRNELPTREPLAIQYKDFSAWQNKLITGPVIGLSRQYWLDVFSKDIPVIDLPTDRERPAAKLFNGGLVPFSLDQSTSEKIHSISRKYNVSTFTTLLALTNVLLSKYTGQHDIVIGSTTAGRDQVELENQIGIFANTLAFRTTFSGQHTFEELLALQKEVTLGAYEHQVYPFDRLLEDLKLERDLSRSPLFDIMIELDDVDVEFEQQQAIEGVDIEPYAKEAWASKYDLTFRFNVGDTIFGGIEYSSDLFDTSTIGRMCNHLAQLICALDAGIDTPLGKLEFINAAERQQVVDFNDTSVELAWDENISARFEKNALQNPEKIALTCLDRTWTYGELNSKVNALAQHLRKTYKVGAQDAVGVMAGRSDRMVIALLGILKAGAAFMPIDPEFPKDRIDYMIANAKIRLVLTEMDFILSLAEHTLDVMAIDIELDVLEPADNIVHTPAQPDDLAYILYTSGSTGMPKGVEVSNRSFVNYITWANRYYFDDTAAYDFPFFTPLTFDLTLTSIFSTLLRGDRLVVYDQRDSNVVLKEIFKPGSTLGAVKLTPSHISLLRHLGLDKTDVKRVIVGGEALTREQVEVLTSLNADIKVFNEYGPTETTVGCMVKEVTATDETILIGKPIANTQIYILNEDQGLQALGVKGEIYIGGVGVAKGYAGNPSLTQQRFLTDQFTQHGTLYRTGDLGRWKPDGNIEFFGRKDGQVKIRGYRIELGEIENALLKHAALKETAVTVIQDRDGASQLAVYYTAESVLSTDALTGYLKDKLPAYMVPAFFVQLEHLPLTANGKVDRKNLPNPLTDANTNRAAYTAPVTDIEKQLARIWENVLRIENISTRENFFQLGGHSLKATQVISEIYKELGVHLDLNKIFSHATIEELATVVENTLPMEHVTIPVVAAQEFYATSHAQRRLWVLSQLEGNSTGFNIPDAFLLKGELNVEAFRKAFATFIERHDSLRTSFVFVDDEVRQKIHVPSDSTTRLDYVDVRNAADGWEQAMAEMRSERDSVFDLENGSLMRAKLFQIEDARFVFLLTMHHLISDGWSFEILIKEISVLYEAFSSSRENPLPPLPIQYKDYAAWQLQYMSGERLEEHRNFWLHYLQGDIKPIEIPTDYPRQYSRTSHGGTVAFSLGASLSEKLRQFSLANNCSVFMSIVALVDVLLHGYTWEKDIVIGFPIAGRNHKSLENQIGYYLNTLPVRVQIDEKDHMENLVRRVRDNILDVYKYQQYSFDLIVEDLDIKRKSNQSPLFDIGITWQNQMGMHSDGKAVFPGVDVEQLDEACSFSKHDVWFYGSESDSNISFRLRYNTDLYKPETMEKVRDNFILLTEQVVNSPRVPIASLVKPFRNNTLSEQVLEGASTSIDENF
ncbi:non-ribosomal peptide synthetase [Chryseolinea lacunae]|uniref:Amino acid adenylation domain-containing protein n=1 Tax=Chryseolinea lacunae TaxID=2801331 RepID=A0ABS1KV42_9BACT|nr:non-ribosomal peptide synthetase [Chryseolinea lacunae]MBL0743068.1 amino acid adenylation domain-containing protein [Chryseolinea lacunae]